MPKITTNSAPQKKSYTFVRVGENLYRVKETCGYYALVKRNRKQIRRSLKTTDKALAKRRLNVLLQKVDKLRVDPKISNITFLEYSSDLKEWLPLKSVKGTGNSIKFVEQREPSFSQQFYRVKEE